jgi:hypothetical protein
VQWNFLILTRGFAAVLVQDDQKVSMHLMVIIQSSGAQRLFDHPVKYIMEEIHPTNAQLLL